jgi:hypothetical protein
MTYQGACPTSAVDCAYQLIEQTLALHPTGIILVGAYGEKVPVPSSEERKRIARKLLEYTKHVLMGATVIEGDGMAAMAKRVATSMMYFVVGPGYPHWVTRTLAQACDLVASRAVDDAGAPMSQGRIFTAANAMISLPPVATSDQAPEAR